MAGEHGIESIEKFTNAFVAAGVRAKLIGADGWQYSDAGLIVRDRELMDNVGKALDAAPEIDEEILDLDFAEIFRLGGLLLPALGKFAQIRN